MRALWGGLVAIAAMVLVSSTAIAGDGPFGISMGSKLSDYEPCEKVKEGVFSCGGISKKLLEIESYNIFYSNKTGVCKIDAISKPIKTDKYGHIITRKANFYADIIGKAYDLKMERVEISLSYEDLNSTVYNMLGGKPLYNFYSKEKDIKYDISSIYISINSIDIHSGYITIEFFFKNYKECLEEIKKDVAEAVFQ